MAGINKVILVGNLGKDPEVRYMNDGTPVANFNIATSEEWTDKQTGDKRNRTEWHRIVAWRRLGEICGQYLSKGRQVYIEGKLQTRSWEQDGITRYTTEIIASTVQFLGRRGDTGSQGGYQGGGYQGGGYQGGGYQDGGSPAQGAGGYQTGSPTQQGPGGYQQSSPAQQSPGGYQQTGTPSQGTGDFQGGNAQADSQAGNGFQDDAPSGGSVDDSSSAQPPPVDDIPF